MKRLPRTTLALLLGTYGVYGWLFSSTYTTEILLLETALVFLISLFLTAPIRLLRIFFARWMNSDTRAFISVIAGALAGVFILSWINVFSNIFVLLSAGALARLDLQTSKFNAVQAFWILLIVSLSGFGLGLIINRLILNPSS
ncbi:hypothetical protein H6H02_23325 [Coleofasciculus sp. FACHB-1120]|nr:hypothetical protein [Coleofasciculus sp. FACHB-1120]